MPDDTPSKTAGTDVAVRAPPDDTLFDAHRGREQPRRFAVSLAAGIAVGYAAWEFSRWTGIVLPEYVGIPLTFLGAIATWKGSKRLLRALSRRKANTPARWAQMSDQEIVSYARSRLRDLAAIERHRGWKEVYCQLSAVPEQLRTLLRPWRKANRDRERLQARLSVYPSDDASDHVLRVKASLEEAVKAMQERSDCLACLIAQHLTSFDAVDAWFSKAQHGSGTEAGAIAAARETVRRIGEDADSILQGIKGAEEAASGEDP